MEPVNIGTGEDISIADFAEQISGVVGYSGKIGYDESKPDGTMLKRLDVSKINSLVGAHPLIYLMALNQLTSGRYPIMSSDELTIHPVFIYVIPAPGYGPLVGHPFRSNL